MPETIKVHGLNPDAVWHTKSLSDAVGMTQLSIHLVRMEPGKEITQFHFHHQEEFIYIISGKGIAEIGEEQFVVTGDFVGFTAPSLHHWMRNLFEVDLIYLMGGKRRSFDVCDCLRLKKRFFELMASTS